jgi:hypothetical protein
MKQYKIILIIIIIIILTIYTFYKYFVKKSESLPQINSKSKKYGIKKNSEILLPRGLQLNYNSKKYAICMWGEPRSIKSTINNFNKYLLEPLNADLFIVTQKTNTDIDKNIYLFKKNVISIKPYNKYENTDKILKILNKLDNKENYIINATIQIYLNMYNIFINFGNIFNNNYEYIILTRSDFLHLFEFPNIDSIRDKNIFWCYEGHEWGGINFNLLIVPSKYIKEYLFSMYDMLNDFKNIDLLNSLSLNIEKFIKLIFDKNKWEIGRIENNAFITADSKNEITNWGKIQYDKELKSYYKYQEQVDNIKVSLKKYKNGKRWKYINEEGNKFIILD